MMVAALFVRSDLEIGTEIAFAGPGRLGGAAQRPREVPGRHLNHQPFLPGHQGREGNP